MTSSVRDTLCKHNPASSETDHVCDWCQSIIDFQPRKGWQVHLPPEQHERAITLIGDPSATSARKWNMLSDNTQHLDHVQWARLPEPIEPILQPPHSWDAFQDLADAVLRGDGLSLHQEDTADTTTNSTRTLSVFPHVYTISVGLSRHPRPPSSSGPAPPGTS